MMTRAFLLSLIALGAIHAAAHAQHADIEPIIRLAWPDDEAPPQGEHRDSLKRITIHEEQRQVIHPLLPIVYFDALSARIPERYPLFADRHAARDFADTMLGALGTLGRYRAVLNVIGYRMERHPETRIAIAGGYVLEDGETEQLARDRVDVVADYLIVVWRIDPSRLTILPPEPADCPRGDTACAAESRFVRIASRDWEIVKPILLRWVERWATPETLQVVIDPKAPTADVAAGSIEFTKGWAPWFVRDLAVDDASGTLRGAIDLTDRERLDIIAGGSRVRMRAVIIMKDGERRESGEMDLPLAMDYSLWYSTDMTPDIDERYYTLFLYPAKRTTLDSFQMRLLKEFIIDELDNVLSTTITGFDAFSTDSERIREVQSERAENVAAYLLKWVDSTRLGRLAVRDAGTPHAYYSNDLPEGRAYNRTVSIVVARPMRGYPLHED